MKKRFFAITLIVIGAFIACKKVGETVADKKYSDVELNIDKNSSFKEEERKIKEGVMEFPALTKDERKTIVKSIIMDNKNVKGILGATVIFDKMTLKEKADFIKTISPNRNFQIFNNITKKIEYEYTNGSNLRERSCLMSIYPAKVGGYASNCRDCGSDMCMLYYSCIKDTPPLTNETK